MTVHTPHRALTWAALAAATLTVILTLASASPAASSSVGSAGPAGIVPTHVQLAQLHDQLQTWLLMHGMRNFHVAELMAFADNDYAAVVDASGKNAFELLVAPKFGWLMEEPASMMWNTKFGMLTGTGSTSATGPMMGGGMMSDIGGSWYATGTTKVTSIKQAVRFANHWLSEARPGELAEADGRAFPGYFTLDTTRAGKTTGMLSVNAATGAVWYHGWHGAFLAELQF